MVLSEEEAKSIKEQLMKQLESLPPEQRNSVKSRVEEMNAEELEEFLKQNNMIKEGGKSQGEECVFCSIVSGKVPGYKIDENKSGIALLEINPLSLGHSIVLSRKHNKLPSSAFSLASKIAKRIKSKLKPEDVKIENTAIMGHQIIQVIPIYKDKKLEKKQASEKELILLQDKLKAKPRVKRKKSGIVEQKPLEKAPRRIP